jgi:hypothetical protein
MAARRQTHLPPSLRAQLENEPAGEIVNEPERLPPIPADLRIDLEVILKPLRVGGLQLTTAQRARVLDGVREAMELATVLQRYPAVDALWPDVFAPMARASVELHRALAEAFTAAPVVLACAVDGFEGVERGLLEAERLFRGASSAGTELRKAQRRARPGRRPHRRGGLARQFRRHLAAAVRAIGLEPSEHQWGWFDGVLRAVEPRVFPGVPLANDRRRILRDALARP